MIGVVGVVDFSSLRGKITGDQYCRICSTDLQYIFQCCGTICYGPKYGPKYLAEIVV